MSGNSIDNKGKGLDSLSRPSELNSSESLQNPSSETNPIPEQIGPKFEHKLSIPEYMKQAVEVLATAVAQSFRLPGSDRVVQDRRGEAEGAVKKDESKEVKKDEKGAGKEKAKTKKDGRAVDTNVDKTRSKKADDPEIQIQARSIKEGGAHAISDKLERILSAFEDLLIARFEQGKQVAEPSADGKPKFREKTQGEWREFFAKFMDRTVGRRVSLNEVREFLLRGVVQKGAKGIVISDMLLANGRVEKFIRFSVMATVLEKLKMLLPGEAFTRSEIAALSQEELNYLALAVARSADAVAEEAERGKFFDAQAEARAAQELGLPMSQHLSAKSRLLRKQRKLGLGGLLGSSEGEIFEDPAPTQFIPWWHWENLKKPSPARSVTAVFYTALGIVALIGIGVLTMRLL